MKKIIGGLVGLFIFVPLVSSATVNTIEELRSQINSLLAMVAQLQAQLASQTGTSEGAFCFTFNTDLKIGDRGGDVSRLHAALEREGFSIPDSERPQKDGENIFGAIFGEMTASRVSAFQEKYRSEILTPAGLSYPSGYVGARTRAKINQLYGCSITPTQPISCPAISTLSPSFCPNGKIEMVVGSNGCSTPTCISTTQPIACTLEAKLCPDGSYVGRTGPKCEFAACPTTVELPKLSISVDASSPSNQTVNSGSANTHVASFKLSSSNTYTKIGSVRFGMTGYPFCPGNAYYLYSGSILLGSVFRTDSGCNFLFDNLNYLVPPNVSQVLSIKMDIPPETGSGNFAIQLKEVGVELNTSISGLPATANNIFVNHADSGAIVGPTLLGANDTNNTSTLNIKAGASDVEVGRFKFIAKSEEDITIKEISVVNNSPVCQVNNLKLFDGNNQIGSTAVTPNFNGFLGCGFSFDNINFIIPKNSSKTLGLKVSVPTNAQAQTTRFIVTPSQVYWTPSGRSVSITNTDIYSNPVSITASQATAKPDLIVGATYCEPLNVNVNENKIFCQVTVWNNSSVDVTKSFDVNIQGSAVTINGLKAQERKTVKNPSGFGFSVAGNYTLNFPIDIWNTVDESDENNNSHSMTITISDTPAQAPTGVLSFYKNSLDFTYTHGGPVPYLQLLTFTNNSNVNINYTLSIQNKPSWLSSHYASDTLTISPGVATSVLASVDPIGLTTGSYTTNLVINGNFIGSPISIPINLTVGY